MTKAYRFHLAGFSGTVSSTKELQARVGELKRSYPSLIGQFCDVIVGERCADGSGYYYPPQAAHRIQVQAA